MALNMDYFALFVSITIYCYEFQPKLLKMDYLIASDGKNTETNSILTIFPHFCHICGLVGPLYSITYG